MKRENKTLHQYLNEGAVILNETKSHATLKLKRKWSWTVFLILTLVFNIFGLIGYIIYHNIRTHGKVITIEKRRRN